MPIQPQVGPPHLCLGDLPHGLRQTESGAIRAGFCLFVPPHGTLARHAEIDDLGQVSGLLAEGVQRHDIRRLLVDPSLFGGVACLFALVLSARLGRQLGG